MRNNSLLCITALFLALSCTKKNTSTSERFYFRTDGADLAVQIDGNFGSKTFIIVLHGGPGGGALTYNQGYYADELEKKYAMVYLDQRGNGASQGNFSSEDLTLEQNSKDIYALTLFMKQKYGSDISIFLMGHSWGGITSAHALIYTKIQSEIKGWIEVDGAHDIAKSDKEAAKMFLIVGAQEVAAGNNLDFWNPILEKVSLMDTNNLTASDQTFLNTKGFEAEGKIAEVTFDEPNGSPAYGFFTSPDASIAVFLNNQAVNNPLNNDSYKNLLTDRLNEITIPCQFLWGKYDFVVPIALGFSAYNLVNTTNKELVVFQNSGHSPMNNEAKLFVQEVTDFIELYK